jgi:hypothetical protein
MLDETMVGTLSIDLSPLVRGALLCHGISLCQQVGDSKRAGWWIEAGDRATSACGLNFSGECHMHRAEVLKSQGSLARAEAEALRSAQGHHEDAVPLLRSGISQWLEIGAPYEAASGGKEGTPGQGHRTGCRVPDLRRAS